MNRTRLVVPSALLAASLLQACGGGAGSPDAVLQSDPELKTSQAELDESLNCTPFQHPDKPPVLLVHGTFVTGVEQYTLFYAPQLVDLGFDVCLVTYPDRGLGDMQVSAEYIVNALRSIHSQTGRKVAMIGHSQGALMPRWALKFFPSAREAVSDFVMLAGPAHGTSAAFLGNVVGGLFEALGLGQLPFGLLPEVIYQFTPDSNFIAALNAGDETPGDIEYTSIYTRFDELVRPVDPVPTAALEFGGNNSRVANILLQDVCPGYLTEHFTIGTSDPVAFALVLDAIDNSGPANVERAGGPSELCGLLPVDLTALLQAEPVRGLLEIVGDIVTSGIPRPHLEAAEPALMDYAAGEITP
ncbi:MAG: esterase/lipase family protein [Panacagrimonas sp.]